MRLAVAPGAPGAPAEAARVTAERMRPRKAHAYHEGRGHLLVGKKHLTVTSQLAAHRSRNGAKKARAKLERGSGRDPTPRLTGCAYRGPGRLTCTWHRAAPKRARGRDRQTSAGPGPTRRARGARSDRAVVRENAGHPTTEQRGALQRQPGGRRASPQRQACVGGRRGWLRRQVAGCCSGCRRSSQNARTHTREQSSSQLLWGRGEAQMRGPGNSVWGAAQRRVGAAACARSLAATIARRMQGRAQPFPCVQTLCKLQGHKQRAGLSAREAHPKAKARPADCSARRG